MPSAGRDAPGLRPPEGLSSTRLAELRAKAAVLITRAILTLAAVPDHEQRFRAPPKCSLPSHPEKIEVDFEVQLRVWRGEGWRSAHRFCPTPKDLDCYLDVLAWLAWLGRQPHGEREVRLFFARAHDIPWWRISQIFGRSEDTLKRWHGIALDAVTCHFWRAIDRV